MDLRKEGTSLPSAKGLPKGTAKGGLPKGYALPKGHCTAKGISYDTCLCDRRDMSP